MSQNPPPPPGSSPPPSSPPAESPGAFGVGDAFSWAWWQYKRHAGILIGLSIIVFVSSGIVRLVANRVGHGGSAALAVLLSVIAFVIGLVLQAGLIHATNDIAEGRTPKLGTAFTGNNLLHLVGASIVVSVLVTVGFIFLIVPGVVLAVLTWYSPWFVVVQKQTALGSIGASFRFVASRFWFMLGFLVLCFVLYVVSALLLLLPLLLLTGPVVALAQIYVFRAQQAHPIAA